MPELPLTKAEDTTEDVTVTVPTVLHTTDTVMVVGIMDMTMYMAVSLAAIKAAAAGIKEVAGYDDQSRRLLRRTPKR